MSAFWDDVDDEQMTHSDEPTTEREWERRIQSLKDDSGDIICDLEDQVKWLEAELHDSAKNVLSLSASLGKKIERVSELDRLAESWLCMDGLTVRAFFAGARCPDCEMSTDWLAEALGAAPNVLTAILIRGGHD